MFKEERKEPMFEWAMLGRIDTEADLEAAAGAAQSVINLARYGTGRNRAGQGVFPKVTHQATPGAFFVGEQNDGGTHELMGG